MNYFSTPLNQGVAPGDYYWGPVNSDVLPAATNPTRSRQIFAEYFDQDTWAAVNVPVSSARFSTALHTLTTVDNPAFGVKAGQRVELLYIRINSEFPRELDPLDYKDELGELAVSLATNDELLERIMTFAGTTMAPTTAPSAAPNEATRSPSSASTTVLPSSHSLLTTVTVIVASAAFMSVAYCCARIVGRW